MKLKSFLKRRSSVVFVIVFAAISFALLSLSNASEVELNSLQPIKAANSAGAHLPIDYSLNDLKGDIRYVATNGSDNNSGSKSAPYKTLNKAINSSSTNGTVVVRGGTYREGAISTSYSKPIKIIAYPGEIPVFNGSEAANSGWATDGSLKFRSYNPQPVTSGSGINFPGGQNLTGDKVGKYPDQAWVGNKELRQVTSKSSVNDDTFYVDQGSKRLYITKANANKSDIEVSKIDKFLRVRAPNVTIEGLRIMRFSNSADDYGVMHFEATADNSVLRNVEIIDAAFQTIQYAGNSNLLDNSLMENVTLDSGNWMGVGALYTDNLVMDSVKITNMNDFGEFTTSPQSGALKTSRTRYTKVINSDISNNKSHGLWFDQSNVDIDVANSKIVDNTGTGVFFEISDDLLLINNYIKSPSGGAQAVKLAGSSGLKLVNNTIVGGKDPIGVYVDNRSKPGCSDPSKPLCQPGYNSDRDSVRPLHPTLDFMPRIDLMINNIVAYPQASQYCGGVTAMCITGSNAGATQPLQNVIHKADPSRGIPKTIMNGNVYANSNGNIVRTPIGNYSTVSQFSSAMAKSPVNISGLESSGKSGAEYVNSDGTPTQSLNSVHDQAVSVPSNSNINEYVPVGTKYFGAISDNTNPPDPLCQDPTANNTGGPLPCTYDPPPDNADFTWSGITEGQEVTGSLPIETITFNASVEQFDYYIDNQLSKTDKHAPHCLAPTNTINCQPYDFSNLTPGNHTLKAVMTYDTNKTLEKTINFTTPETSPTYDPDINQDGNINLVDLSILMGNWDTKWLPNQYPRADINKDNKVGLIDLSIFMDMWR